MKAIRIDGPGAATVVEVPTAQHTPGEVLLKVKLVGMCGTDLNTYRGRNSMVAFPRIIGHEVAATIVSGGEDLAAGTRVTLSPYTSCNICPSCLRGRPNACVNNQTLGVQRDGAMTEYIVVPREKLYPANLTLRELCLVEPLTVGFHAVARGRVTATDSVAIFGCGGIGLGAISASAFRQANTIAIDMDSTKLAIAIKAGANHVINTQTEDLHSRLQQITNGRGPDVVIEAIGLAETFRAAVEEVAFTGRVVYIGYAKEPVCYETRLFVQKELDIMGSRNALPEDFLEVIRMLESGNFPVEETISIVVPSEAAPGILADWSAAHAKYTKIIVQMY
jgi:threonine dehydrogenase-like Zn-dependent dehydrogenase